MSKTSARGDGGAFACGRSLSLQAETFVLAETCWWDELEPMLPTEVSARHFTSPATYLEELSGNVAVALVSATVSAETRERVVRETYSRSRPTRIVFLATDGADLLACEAPYDRGFVFPDERDEFESAFKRLYVRAYYVVALERFYEIGLSIRNRELGDDEDELETLRRARRRVRSYLLQFRAYLDPEDFEAIENRDDRLGGMLETVAGSSDPTSLGLPATCPDCGLDWTSWHGPRRRDGYERIGASTWRCTGCGHVVANPDPDNYRVS